MTDHEFDCRKCGADCTKQSGAFTLDVWTFAPIRDDIDYDFWEVACLCRDCLRLVKDTLIGLGIEVAQRGKGFDDKGIRSPS